MWCLNDFEYRWPTKEMKIYRDYSIEDYKKDSRKLLLSKNIKIEGIIYVQVLNNQKQTGLTIYF